MHIHILGVCGTFMAGLARLAVALGHRVTGADQGVYPPMSTQLEELGIAVHAGYSAASLTPRPDLVLVGNVLTRGMPVIEHLLDARIPYLSGPQWLRGSVLDQRWVLAVAGTHGKTTTSAMLAFILRQIGHDPGFLIGGVPGNESVSARLGTGAYFVIEADEYDTAFFDKRAKFVHYPARTLVLNNVEHDHADIYPSLADVQRQFHHLVRLIPGQARIIAGAPEPALERVLEMGCWTPVERVGLVHGDWTAAVGDAAATRFDVHHGGQRVGHVDWRCFGLYNVRNALAAIAAAGHVGVAPAAAATALAGFVPPARRQELRASIAGISVYLDFAHHPTAVRVAIQAVAARTAGRVLAILELRSNTMRAGTHALDLREVLAAAGPTWVIAAEDTAWSPAETFAALRDVEVGDEPLALAVRAAACARAGDAVLIMSNGDGARLADAVVAHLGQRELQIHERLYPIPVFALGTVLFPEGELSLRVFEPRYLDMVKSCMRSASPFAVCLLRAGADTGRGAQVHAVGCTARIVDFDALDDGLLGITARGGMRIRISTSRLQPDDLMVADVEPLTAEPPIALPTALAHLAEIARAVREQLGTATATDPARAREAVWVGHRLAESLPMSTGRRQSMLELDDPIARLEQLDAIVHELAAQQT